MLVDENGLGGDVAVQHPGARVQEPQALGDLPNVSCQKEIREQALRIPDTLNRQNCLQKMRNLYILNSSLNS